MLRYAYVYMYICIYVYMYICIHFCQAAWSSYAEWPSNAYIYIRIHVIHTYTYTCIIYTYVCMYICIRAAWSSYAEWPGNACAPAHHQVCMHKCQKRPMYMAKDAYQAHILTSTAPHRIPYSVLLEILVGRWHLRISSKVTQ